MGLYKWIFKKLTGIELVEPDLNFLPDENDAEKYLNSSDRWPKTISGRFYLSDSSGDDEHCFHWVIGSLEMDGFDKEVLLEFRDEVLIESGLNEEEFFPLCVTVQIDPVIQEYYQVVGYQKT